MCLYEANLKAELNKPDFEVRLENKSKLVIQMAYVGMVHPSLTSSLT